MKICFLSDAKSVHTIKWCKYFSSKGHDVHVISLRGGEIDSVKVYGLGFEDSIFESGSLASKLKYLTKVPRVRKIIKKINPDIIHAHYATSYGLIASLALLRPFWLSVWGSDVYEFPSGMIKKTMLKFVLARAKYVFSTSKAMAEKTGEFTKKNIEITPFGVDTSIFKPLSIKKDPEKIIIGCLKKLEPHYGIHHLISAFSQILPEFEQKDINLELHIAGEGIQKSELIQLVNKLNVEKYVKWLGFVSPQEKVVETFNTFDIAVVPSLAESFGVSAIEAQACGIPVVASKVGGLPETVLNGKTGFLVPPHDPDALAWSIKMLIKDPDLRKKFGTQGREFVCREYDYYDNFQRVEEIYSNVLKSK